MYQHTHRLYKEKEPSELQYSVQPTSLLSSVTVYFYPFMNYSKIIVFLMVRLIDFLLMDVMIYNCEGVLGEITLLYAGGIFFPTNNSEYEEM